MVGGLQRLTGKIRFAEGLPPAQFAQVIQQAVEAHGKVQLLAFAYGHLQDRDRLSAHTDTEMYVLLTALNLVDCVSAAAAKAKRRPSA